MDQDKSDNIDDVPPSSTENKAGNDTNTAGMNTAALVLKLVEQTQNRTRLLWSAAISAFGLSCLAVYLVRLSMFADVGFLSFFGLIGLALVGLLTFGHKKLRMSKRVLEGINHHLPPEDIHAVRDTLLKKFAIKRGEKDAELDREKLDTASVQVTLLHEKFVKILKVSDDEKWPIFIHQRLTAVTEALQACSAEPDNAQQVLQAAHTRLPPEQDYRSFGQGLASLLLFIGIIGTFYGLLHAFTSESVSELISSLTLRSSGNEFEPALEHLMEGFGLAFGSSMVAYIMNIGGRFMLDQTDEDYDALIAFLDFGLLNQIHIALAPLNVQVRVELRDKSRKALEKVADTNKEAGEIGAASIAEANRIAEAITNATASLLNAVATTDASITRILAGIRDSREEWSKANSEWSKTTGKFSKSSIDLVSAVEKSVTGINDVTNAINEQTIEITENWASSSNKVLQEIQDTATSISTHWQDAVQTIVASMGESALGYGAKLQSFQDRLEGLIADLDATHKLVENAAQVVSDGQKDLGGQITTLVDIESGARQSVLSASNDMVTRINTQTGKVIDNLQGVSHELKEYSAALDTLSRALGTGEGEDHLIEVLRKIDGLLQRATGDSRHRSQFNQPDGRSGGA